MSLSADQYERLFFQPSAAKGDLAKRLGIIFPFPFTLLITNLQPGNPTLLGVLGFLIPFSSTVFSLLQFQGSSTASLTSVSGTYYFLGGIAMNIAGIFEFILGNTFPMVVFIIYGSHWVNLAYLSDPAHGIVASYAVGEVPGAFSQAYNAGQGNYNVVMAVVSFIFLCGSLRINVPFVLVFLGLVFLFSFIAAADYQLGYNATAAGAAHAVYYVKIAGGFGFVTMIMGWYVLFPSTCYNWGKD
jgi:succinate-acetate transporter protein